jgi:mutator protein MutT
MASQIRVLAAVISREGRWLLCRRPPHKRHGGCWEFPGGKLEEGEGLLEAALRELREELAVEVVTAGAALYSRPDPGSPFIIEFVPVEVAGEPQPLEHSELAWVLPADAAALHLAPADADFVRFMTGATPPTEHG